MRTELHTCRITDGTIHHQSRAIARFIRNNPGEREVLLGKPGDDVREHALCSDSDDIFRVVACVKLLCRRNGIVIEYGQLGPRKFEESLRQGAHFPAETRRYVRGGRRLKNGENTHLL